MTLGSALILEPALPFDDITPPPQAPPRADLPADTPVWEVARRSYVEDGLSCPVVAERHRLHMRAVQRRAADEDWPALRACYRAAEAVRRREAAPPEGAHGPAVELVEAVRADRLAELLVHVSGDGLVREAARLAAEATAGRRPQEALHWLRVAREAERMSARIDRALAGCDPLDTFRAGYLHTVAADIDAVMGEPDEKTAAEAPSVSPCHPDLAK